METIKKDGWNAITETFEKIYPQQKDPLHYGTLISWRLGGNDPLRGVSIYEEDDYYHFVTYGFSELFEKESSNKEYSGYGFEIVLKLKKETSKGIIIDDVELKGMVSILQSIARYVFENNVVFQNNEYFYSGQVTGMDRQEKSKITGFVVRTSDIGIIETPFGKVEFLEFIGMSDKELRVLVDQKATRNQVGEFIDTYHLKDLYTDYNRDDLF